MRAALAAALWADGLEAQAESSWCVCEGRGEGGCAWGGGLREARSGVCEARRGKLALHTFFFRGKGTRMKCRCFAAFVPFSVIPLPLTPLVPLPSPLVAGG